MEPVSGDAKTTVQVPAKAVARIHVETLAIIHAETLAMVDANIVAGNNCILFGAYLDINLVQYAPNNILK